MPGLEVPLGRVPSTWIVPEAFAKTRQRPDLGSFRLGAFQCTATSHADGWTAWTAPLERGGGEEDD